MYGAVRRLREKREGGPPEERAADQGPPGGLVPLEQRGPEVLEGLESGDLIDFAVREAPVGADGPEVWSQPRRFKFSRMGYRKEGQFLAWTLGRNQEVGQSMQGLQIFEVHQTPVSGGSARLRCRQLGERGRLLVGR